MTLRAAVSRALSSALTSPELRQWQAGAHALRRHLLGHEPEVHYFHQADDPYSQLTAELLPRLRERYCVRIVPHLVPPPAAAAAPDAERLAAWSRRDAQRLAASLALPWPAVARSPVPMRVAAAQAALTHAWQQGDFVDRVAPIGRALWSDAAAEAPRAGFAETERWLAHSARLRERWGHYLGATFYFEGEWYWGVDRLAHLEHRLREVGLDAPGAPTALLAPVPQAVTATRPAPRSAAAPVLDFFCSLRSPYTYLAAARVHDLARRHGAELRLRFVLPMVMRGLPVPPAKRRYILLDAKREAERLGLPFGTVVDPVGVPTERGLALLHHAVAQGRGPQLLESFLQGVFAEGIDAGSARGLRRIAERAGLAGVQVSRALADGGWRAVAEANRAELLAEGLWGVPALRVRGFPAVWGQDRLWMVEQDLAAAARQG